MGLKVEFEFKPRDRVEDGLEVMGLVTMAGVGMESSKPQYFVKTKTGGQWWMEDQLRLIKAAP